MDTVCFCLTGFLLGCVALAIFSFSVHSSTPFLIYIIALAFIFASCLFYFIHLGHFSYFLPARHPRSRRRQEERDDRRHLQAARKEGVD